MPCLKKWQVAGSDGAVNKSVIEWPSKVEGKKSGHTPLGKRELNAKIHLAVDAHGMPVRFFITSGTTADCTIAARLIEGFHAEYFLADRGYDMDAIILKAVDEGMIPVIPPIKIENICGNTANVSTNSAILLRMRFCFSKNGAVLLRAMLKTPLLSLPLSKSVVLLSGSVFIDGTI